MKLRVCLLGSANVKNELGNNLNLFQMHTFGDTDTGKMHGI